MSRERLGALRLLAVTDTRLATVEAHAEAYAATWARLPGAFGVLVREKSMTAREQLAFVARLRSALPGALVLVADRADVAAVAADGVHLGEAGLSVGEARRVVGDGLVTRAAHQATPDAELAGADAWLVSPVFDTPGKEPAVGLAGVRRFAGRGVPVVALGGITPRNARSCLETGALAVAAIRGCLAPGAAEAWDVVSRPPP